MGRMRKQTCVEECSKVIKSLLKYRMKGRLGRTCDERMLPNIKEVIAEAQKRVDQLHSIYGDTAQEEKYKLERLTKKLEGTENE